MRLGVALRGLVAGLLVLALADCAEAASFEQTDVTDTNGRIGMSFSVVLDADPAVVQHHLTDYDRLYQLSDLIVESETLAADWGSGPRVRIVLRACVLFFCQTMRRVMTVQRTDSSAILRLADPAESDFSYANEIWRVHPHGRGTRLTYEAEFEPNFFVPPLIGPWLIKLQLRAALEEVVINLERLAVRD